MIYSEDESVNNEIVTERNLTVPSKAMVDNLINKLLVADQ